jgi:hypothetical protein
VLARNSRREFFASHRAARELVAESALVLSVASRQTNFVITTSGGSEASCKERGLSGMVLSTIPDKTQKFLTLLCVFCLRQSCLSSVDSSEREASGREMRRPFGAACRYSNLSLTLLRQSACNNGPDARLRETPFLRLYNRLLLPHRLCIGLPRMT